MLSRRTLLSSLAAAPAFAQTRPKNILFLIADDLGLNVGAYGDKAAKTPHLDALAADGVRFENAFCTTASCSPSRSVMLSGLHNHANGQYGLAHAVHHQGYLPFVKPLPSLLKDAGYRTGVIGKLHVNAENRFRWDLDQSNDGGRNGVAMAAKAKDFLAAAGSQPWYLHIGFTDPHRAAQGFANRDYPGIVRTPFEAGKVPVPPFLPDNTATQGEVAEYYEACNRMDQGVGAFIKLLKDSGQYDNTLIVFISDNGMPFPNAKTNLYEAATHLPLIVRRPGTKPGLVNQGMASWTDLTPTFLDWAGARGPDYPLHGRSLLPILDQERPAGWDEVYLSHTFHEITMNYPMRAVRTRQYKYIRNLAHGTAFPFATDLWNSKMWQSLRPEGNNARLGQRSARDYLYRAEEELYDISKDSNEISNLAGRAEHKTTLESLRAKVKDFRVRTKDPWMILTKHSGEDESVQPPA